jgi:hypothetical protein
MTTKPLPPNTNDPLDEEGSRQEERAVSSRRRRRRGLLVSPLVAVTCLTVVGVIRLAPTAAASGTTDRSSSAMAATTCSSARVRLLGVTSIPGAAVTAGVLVRASISSSVACSMSGYPTLLAQLSNRSTAVAGDQRSGIFGGLPPSSKANSTLPRISITSHSRVVSFTMAFFSGNGPTCPRINAVRLTLPGSRRTLSARTMREGGVVGRLPLGSFCGNLDVTPLVNGSSGKS